MEAPAERKEKTTLELQGQNRAKLKSLKVSVRAFLDTAKSRELKDKTNSVRLRVIHDKKIRLYSVNVSLTPEEWAKILKGQNLNGLESEEKAILKELKRAHDIIVKMEAFTWGEFGKKFTNSGTSFENVWVAFSSHIEGLKRKQKYSNSEIYRGALNSFKRFYIDLKKLRGIDEDKFKAVETWERHKLLFKDIDPAWLKAYNEWMKERGRSVTSIGMNARCLRHLFNLGIDDGEIPKSLYPFGSSKKNKYKPPAHRSSHRALNIPEIRALYEYSDEFKEQLKYRDIFIFSYICYGLNLADICLLTWENIDSKYIEVLRKKTEHEDETYTIRILLTDEHRKIIDQHGKGGHYVFDVLKKGDNEETKHRKTKQFTHNLNDNLKRIAWQINRLQERPIFEEKRGEKKNKPYSKMKISSYYARHSFATIARDANIPVSTISQCMGHSQGFGVTGQYFAPPDSVLEKISKILLPWVYNKELTGLHKIVFDTLSYSEQKTFMDLSIEDREAFMISHLSQMLLTRADSAGRAKEDAPSLLPAIVEAEVVVPLETINCRQCNEYIDKMERDIGGIIGGGAKDVLEYFTPYRLKKMKIPNKCADCGRKTNTLISYFAYNDRVEGAQPRGL